MDALDYTILDNTGLDYTTPLHIHKSPYVRIFYGGTE